MANILIKQGREIAGSSLVTPSSKADKTDLTSIIQTGTASSQAISAGTYFYLNDVLVRAKVAIANGATFTLNTNYEVVTAGGLNELNDKISGGIKVKTKTVSTNITAANTYATINFELPSDMTVYLGSIFIVGGVGSSWVFTSGQTDMMLYATQYNHIRFCASVAQAYTGKILTFYI